MNRLIIATASIVLLLVSVSGQQPSGTPPPKPAQDDVLRVTTNLVQVDIVVTDNEGRQVVDLRPEDFEVSENGKRQQITHFSYIAATTLAAAPSSEGAKQPLTQNMVVAPARLRREHVRRTVALVVDDLGLSFESVNFVRQALRRFVDQEMQPTDVVAVLRTSAGVGTLQQFTSDKRLIHAAIDRVRWYPQGRSGLSPGRTLDEASAGSDFRDTLQFIKEAEDKRAEIYSVGTFGALAPVVQSLGEMPGRKSLVLVSEAFRLFTAEGRNNQLILAMRRLTEQANAASVTIYTMDASGLQTDTIQATDKEGARAYVISAEQFASTAGANNSVATNPSPRTLPRADSLSAQSERDSGDAFRRLNALMEQRRDNRWEAHTVLSYLAASTGGLFMKNRNDLGAALGRIMDDQKGYYLIGYRPDEASINAPTPKMRSLNAKVKRSGVTWRTRSGYFGLTDAEKRPKPKTREEQLVAALVSPFASSDIGIRLTSLFGDDPTGTIYVRSLLHIDANNLALKETGGSRTTDLEIIAVAIGDNGQVVDQLSYPQTVKVTGEEEHQRLLQGGLTYILNFPISKPGAYQMRVAVRDTSSERLGAAMQYVEVPDLSKNRLTLSGVVVSGLDPNNASTGAGAARDSDPQSGPARRKLRQGMVLDYRYNIYNAQTDATAKPQVETQMRLFRDGQIVFTGKPLPLDATQQKNMKRLMGAGRIRLGPDLIPGEYVVQITVTDALAPKALRTATQWTDFEITQ
ncbi:MAG: VWA domain-containing protein [Acidobacteriota bacterium]